VTAKPRLGIISKDESGPLLTPLFLRRRSPPYASSCIHDRRYDSHMLAAGRCTRYISATATADGDKTSGAGTMPG
jgi:hypothetical protein